MTPRQLLKRARLLTKSNLFGIGTFERGVTLYGQQVRALNLIYSIAEAKKPGSAEKLIKSDASIAIIGGGAFGITAAAAAADLGFNTTLFEKHDVLMPLQRGCDTRWIHPRYYDWPAIGTEARSARLPILNWTEGTAGEVADQLVERFEKLWEKNARTLTVVTGAVVKGINSIAGQPKLQVNFEHLLEDREDFFDAVVIATGFGIENSSREYWRNDTLSQVDLGITNNHKSRWLVSGFGDGGLTDIFRLTIKNFRHEKIFFELFSPIEPKTIERLRTLLNSNSNVDGWLYDRLNRIVGDVETGPFAAAIKRLRQRLREDTEVYLNGKKSSFRLSLTADQVSLCNALLSLLLFKLEAFTYIQGQLIHSSKEWDWAESCKKNVHFVQQRIVARHGTDRYKSLQDLGLDSRAIKKLEQSSNDMECTTTPIYEVGWWYKQADKSLKETSKVAAPLELLPVATSALARTWVSTLSDIVKDFVASERAKRDPRKILKFRMTLHRIVQFDDKDYFQQLSDYAGVSNQPGTAGRLFPLKGGIVGLAVESGLPVMVMKKDKKTFDNIWDTAGFLRVGARPIKRHVRSLLACPFFAANTDGAGSRVCLVLFADSSDPKFFSEDMVLRMIYSASKGFVQNLETLVQDGSIKQISSDYPGYVVEQTPQLKKKIDKLSKLGAVFGDEIFNQYKQFLTFRTINSLDLDVGLLGDKPLETGL